MKNYMLTCISGGEEIARDELINKFSVLNLKTAKGKVYFSADINLQNLMSLRCANNIYIKIGSFEVGIHKTDLVHFAANFKKLNFSKFLKNNNINGNKIIVSASKSGKQTYSRFDIQRVAETVLVEQNFTIGKPNEHDIAIRIDVKDKKCECFVQITPAEFRFRSNEKLMQIGSILPTVAACLVWFSKPKNTDVFYDCFVGSGTIAKERAFYKYKKIFASDISNEAIEQAKANLAYENIILFTANACNNKMKTDSVDILISNPPWNKQVQVADVDLFYKEFISEMKRYLKINGKAIVLTDTHEAIIMACKHNNLNIEAVFAWTTSKSLFN